MILHINLLLLLKFTIEGKTVNGVSKFVVKNLKLTIGLMWQTKAGL